jgi:hypothetical protein
MAVLPFGGVYFLDKNAAGPIAPVAIVPLVRFASTAAGAFAG